ncbi:MAG: tetratricopeptide repeat protein, partial [Bryobacteraceae bacterium]
TWLIAPIAAPEGAAEDFAGQTRKLSEIRDKTVLLHFWTSASSVCREQMSALRRYQGEWPILAIDCGKENGDVAAVYSLLYRYLFDRHRDLPLPSTFLINRDGDIVKVYQGPVSPARMAADRHSADEPATLARALPFAGVATTYEFGRNYLSLGSGFFGRGYYDEAESSFARALKENPSSAEALYGMGSVYLKQNRTAAAQEHFQRAVKSDASYPDTLPNAWNNLGIIAAREGRTDQAIGDFQRALSLARDHFEALENLGNAYRQEKRWDDARRALEHAVAVKPTDPEATYGLAMVFAQAGETQRADDLFHRALALRPDYPEALNNLGVLYLRTQRRDQAVETFEKCMRVAPDFDRSYLNLARVYAIEGDTDKARGVLQQLLKQVPGDEQARQALEQLK